MNDLTTTALIKRTLRIPLLPLEVVVPDAHTAGDGEEMTRRLDAALMAVGFKLSTEALQHFSAESPGFVKIIAVRTLAAVRELIGDHVQHNTYFIDFPKNVPDTLEFWVACLREAVTGIAVGERFSYAQLRDAVHSEAGINLLALPTYGEYQHTFEEMLSRHDELIPSLKDRLTILHLGGSPMEEMQRLFEVLVNTTTPPNPADRDMIKHLAQQLIVGHRRPIPFELPGRETKAIINAALLEWEQPRHLNNPGHELAQVNTITDVLRAVDVLSGGDGTLERPAAGPHKRLPRCSYGELEVKPLAEALDSLKQPERPRKTRFVSLTRPQRRRVMATLDWVVAHNEGALADVYRHREAWKRLGEGVHPHEYPLTSYSQAQRVFAVARGDLVVHTVHGFVEEAFTRSAPIAAAGALRDHPGLFARQLDRVLREVTSGSDMSLVLRWFSRVTPQISGRVLLSLIEHFRNRSDTTLPRLFVNRAGRAFVTPDTRAPFTPALIQHVEEVINQELLTRLDKMVAGAAGTLLTEDGTLVKPWIVVGDDIGQTALPLSNKGTATGLGTLPRGSVRQLDDQDILRFFIYWRERNQTTDFDLSIQMLDENFDDAGQVSWTSLRRGDGTVFHSGDIVTAKNGATEMIDVRLRDIDVGVQYLVPQVLVYSGEKFGIGPDDRDAVVDSIFGYQTLNDAQRGAPFEPKTVRMRSDMRGHGNVAIPMVFERMGERWQAKTLNLFMRGTPVMNRVEGTLMTAGLQAQATIRHRYISVRDIVALLGIRGYTVWDKSALPVAVQGGMPVLYLGAERPDIELPPNSRVITLENLTELIPE
jgi:stress response protein SCP2